jgi:proteasome beta subunit
VQLLIGGFDREDVKLFSLDPIGGLIEEKMAATGSGSPVAYGILEQEYSENKSVQDNVPIAIKALSSALKRDSATGDGIDVVVITKDGFRKYGDSEVKAIADKVVKKK